MWEGRQNLQFRYPKGEGKELSERGREQEMINNREKEKIHIYGETGNVHRENWVGDP